MGRAFVRARRLSRTIDFAQYTDRLEASEAIDFIQVG